MPDVSSTPDAASTPDFAGDHRLDPRVQRVLGLLSAPPGRRPLDRDHVLEAASRPEAVAPGFALEDMVGGHEPARGTGEDGMCAVQPVREGPRPQERRGYRLAPPFG